MGTLGTGTSTVFALAVAAALVLSGCDPEPAPSPATTTTPATTAAETGSAPSPEPTVPPPPDLDPPAQPDGMDVDGPDEALVAIGYFFDLYSYMRVTGDTAAFDAMSGPDCRFCASAREGALADTVGDSWTDGGELTFAMDTVQAELPTSEHPNYLFELTLTQAPLTIYRSDGTREVHPEPTVHPRTVVAIERTAGGFIINGVNLP
ncbi:MAG: DUF6318 family protein [Beutenbergiaceae bacterium]